MTPRTGDQGNPHAYATYFDSGYLSRGLVLIESLRKFGDDADVWIMCLDEATKSYLDGLGDPSLRTLTISDLEATEPRLLEVRPTRSRMEYVFTCTPLLIRHVMREQQDPTTVVTYLDADLGFFADPLRVFGALGEGSVGIIEHRYPPRLERRLGKYGRFNVGWVGIRADDAGFACVDWWSERCIEWCFDTPSEGRYADQGYLDEFPERFDGVVVLPDAGFDVAPWNTARHRLSTSSDGTVVVDDDQLVFFHFHGIKRRGRWFVTSQLVYRSPMRTLLRRQVYVPYLARLDRFDAALRSTITPVVARRGKGLRGLAFNIARAVLDLGSIVTGNAIRSRRPPG